ncbi:MAG: ATP-binding cassette domain-containing protein [Fimbriimonadaceae bacterium]|nr:ATP-binding cassette domain-containing protein [Fimbriimonadaceae bacterium]
MIQACGVGLEYADHGKSVCACAEIDLEVKPAEFLGVLGPSGSGKSSLLYLLSGLKRPTSGRVEYRGTSLSTMQDAERAALRWSKFGFVFQQPYLLGYLTAVENVTTGCPGTTMEEAMERLSILGLAEKAHRLPHELSGGERQRVCVARALAGSPEVVFADEPTANLDHTKGFEVVAALLQNRGEGALVLVTHDPAILKDANRTVTMNDGRLSCGMAPTRD